MPSAIIAQRGHATAAPAGTNIRTDHSASASIVKKVPGGQTIEFAGFTDTGEPVNGNATWYTTPEGNWFSATAVQRIIPGEDFFPLTGTEYAGVNGTNIRSGPTLAAPIVRSVVAGGPLTYDGYTMNGSPINGNCKWFRTTPDGHWFSETAADITNGRTLQTLLHKPFAGPFSITQVFGVNPEAYRRFGLAGHDGIDYGLPSGTPVLAAASGMVTYAAPDASGFGNLVVITHSFGRTFYGHLQGFTIRAGLAVKAGDEIALSDNTGNSTGPHLHFGLKMNGRTNQGYYDFIDPSLYLG